MEENKRKVNFLNRIRIAIFKLEDYGLFLGEKFSVAIKYFFLLICVVSLIIVALDAWDLNKMLTKSYSYIENELPDFIYQNEKLKINNIVEAYDEEYSFKLIIDTKTDINEEEIKNYKNKIYDSGFGILALEEKLIYIGNNYETEYTYEYFLNLATVEISNKEDLNILMNQTPKEVLVVSFAITNFIITYVNNLLSVFLDILVVAVFGIIAARFFGMRFKTKPMISLAIYSMTLSITLVLIYRIINFYTGFIIDYFSIMYILIGYVYIIAAIMMIKYDLIKQQFELAKILEVQKQVHKEIEEEKEDNEKEENKDVNEDNKNSKEENKEENELELNGAEPDGSEI